MINYIKSPLNYTGGKSKILNQILPLFPTNIRHFVDLFCGGCNVGINVSAKDVIFNDNIVNLIDFYKTLQKNSISDVVNHIEHQILKFNLSDHNKEAYLKFREEYNTKRNPLDLFVLVAYSFNHQVRFNNFREYNVPFGQNRSTFNNSMKSNLMSFMNKLHSMSAYFFANNFNELSLDFLTKDDFVYADPPYLITKSSYNDGKRGFTGWNLEQEKMLLGLLDNFNKNNIKFALSNVTRHNGLTNDLLIKWIENNPSYKVYCIDSDYTNASYQVKNKDKSATSEVLITNY